MSRGFTIVEMLLYMGILTGFLVVLTQLFTSIIDVQLESQATGPLAQDSRYIFSRLAYDIGRAEEVTTPGAAGVTTQSLGLMIGGVPHTYSVSGSNLTLESGAETNNLNSYGTQVSTLSFTRLGNTDGKHTVQIRYTITSTTQRVSGVQTKTMQTTIGVR